MTVSEKDNLYRMLNDRFDSREKILREQGFKRETIPVLNIAVYTRTRYGKVYAVTASLVLTADEVVWSDEVERICRFCA